MSGLLVKPIIRLTAAFSLSWALGLTSALAEPIVPAPVAPKKLSSAVKKIASVIGKKGVTGLPSAAAALAQNGSTSSASASDGTSTLDVSGTPPSLPTIGISQIQDIFWRPGVVQSIAQDTANQTQCSEFFASMSDGFSGGLGACHMAESVGRSFETILNAGVSLCYMQKFPTTANLRAGGITLKKGRFPSNDVTKLFTPGTNLRTIKITTPAIKDNNDGETKGQKEIIYLRIASQAANTAANRVYRAFLYFCPEGQAQPRGFNIIEISNGGVLSIVNRNNQDPFNNRGANTLTIRGTLVSSGSSLAWNATKSRTATIESVRDEDLSKAEFEITPENYIILKRRDTYQGNLQKGYSITHFTGTDALSAAFLEGAFKGENQFGENSNSFSGATEYRAPIYVAAPFNALLPDVDSFDFANDSFYSSAPSISVDTSSYSCTARADIELSMNKNDTLEATLQTCFNKRLEGMDFCRNNSLVHQAEMNFRSACFMGGGA